MVCRSLCSICAVLLSRRKTWPAKVPCVEAAAPCHNISGGGGGGSISFRIVGSKGTVITQWDSRVGQAAFIVELCGLGKASAPIPHIHLIISDEEDQWKKYMLFPDPILSPNKSLTTFFIRSSNEPTILPNLLSCIARADKFICSWSSSS